MKHLLTESLIGFESGPFRIRVWTETLDECELFVLRQEIHNMIKRYKGRDTLKLAKKIATKFAVNAVQVGLLFDLESKLVYVDWP